MNSSESDDEQYYERVLTHHNQISNYLQNSSELERVDLLFELFEMIIGYALSVPSFRQDTLYQRMISDVYHHGDVFDLFNFYTKILDVDSADDTDDVDHDIYQELSEDIRNIIEDRIYSERFIQEVNEVEIEFIQHLLRYYDSEYICVIIEAAPEAFRRVPFANYALAINDVEVLECLRHLYPIHRSIFTHAASAA
jgi:hypothetical protein